MLGSQPTITLVLVAIAGFLTGLSKGGLGGMMGALITTMLALVLPIDKVIGMMLPILMLGDVFAVAAHWGNWQRKLILSLLPGALLGVTMGTFVITNVSVSALRTALGMIVLIFVLYRLIEGQVTQKIKYQAKWWHALLAGGLAGFTSTLAHAGGPPITIFLLLQDLAPPVFVATAALFFAALNWIKVPYYFYAGLFDFDLLVQIIWLAPSVPLGVWVGRWLSRRVEKKVFEQILLVLLTVSALFLLFKD